MLEALDVHVAYGGVRALDGASLTIRPGTVHALLGENGAGKSTLIKVITGAVVPDSGTLRLNGRGARFASTDDAAQHGVAVVSQELSLFPDLDVLSNLYPTRKPTRHGLVDRRAMAEAALPTLSALGLHVPVTTPVGRLTIGQQQIVEIAGAVLREPSVLVLDEPTSALDAADTERLMQLLTSLRTQNVAVLIVSHILEEVRRLADEVTVLRNGRTVMSARPMAELNIGALVDAMLGDRPPEPERPADSAPGASGASAGVAKPGLRATSISVPGQLHGVSLEARPGEVVGVTGLAGSGHDTLLQVLAGRVQATDGTVTLPNGDLLAKGPLKAIRAGVGLVTGDRRRLGLMLDQPIWENIGHVRHIASSTSWARVSAADLRRRARDHVTRLGIRPADVDLPSGQLSGGNQQKVVLAKWLEIAPSVLLLDDPTRGVDVGAKAEIHKVIRNHTNAGGVAVLSSTDLEELTEFCDRIVVLYEGRIAAELRPPGADTHTVLEVMNSGTRPTMQETA